MPPEDDDQTPNGEGAPAAPAATASAAAAVMDSPEYKELLKQNRKLAREAGTAKASEEAARAEAARIRQAAEAQQQAALEQQIADILGDEGVEAWNDIAELASTNQVEAAKRLRDLMAKAVAQSPAEPPEAPAAGATPPTGGTTVEDHPTPGSLPRGVDASAPLSTEPTDEVKQVITDLETRYTDAVKRNQDPATRNRMTMRDRADALIGYLGAAYLKAGARAKSNR